MKKTVCGWFALAWALLSAAAWAEEVEPLRFGVVNQRSVALTAEAWNPILTYVGHKIGRRLVLKLGKTAPETTAMTERGEHDLAFSNHMFSPARDKLGYRAILRIAGEPIRGMIVVREDSPIRTLKQLQGHTVVFPSRDAPIAYHVPMDHLKRSGIDVRVAFAGNQEGAMAQLQFGKAAAATVNQKILDSYAAREGLHYRVLWTSPPYPDIPIVAHRSLPPKLVAAIREAFIGMDKDPEGRRALQACSDALNLRQSWSFVQADDREYDVYRRFYEKSLVKD